MAFAPCLEWQWEASESTVAMPRPMPDAAPVTIAVLLQTSIIATALLGA
jgi:hypothetical protein